MQALDIKITPIFHVLTRSYLNTYTFIIYLLFSFRRALESNKTVTKFSAKMNKQMDAWVLFIT